MARTQEVEDCRQEGLVMIIGITGSDGGGKGTVVDYLISKGFTHYSSREFIVAEIERQGLPVDRNQMRLTANQLRERYGKEFVVKQAYEKAKQEGKENVVIESIRALAEVEYLKAQGGILLSVDANPELRYQRVQARRSATDKVTYEQFLAHEELEKNDPNPSGMQKAKVMAQADYTVVNESTLPKLHQQIDKFLNEMKFGLIVEKNRNFLNKNNTIG